jgi:hypothetical protein
MKHSNTHLNAILQGVIYEQHGLDNFFSKGLRFHKHEALQQTYLCHITSRMWFMKNMDQIRILEKGLAFHSLEASQQT